MSTVKAKFETFDGSAFITFMDTLDRTFFRINIENNSIENTISNGEIDEFTLRPSGITITVESGGPIVQGIIPPSDIVITCNRPELGIDINFFGMISPTMFDEIMRQIKDYKVRTQLANALYAEQAGIVDPRARRNASKLVNKNKQPALHQALMRPHGWQNKVASFLVDPKYNIQRAFNITASGTPNADAVGIGPVVRTIKTQTGLGGGRRTRRARK
jgi:hypothetical protein